MRGFTLIEILVTMTIVSVAILSLGSFTLSMVGNGQLSRERLTAVHIAEQVLEYWQHNIKDFAPKIATDCTLTLATSSQSYPATCTPTSGVRISYSIKISQSLATGPLPTSLTSFKPFSKKGFANTPQTKAVKVSWVNHAQKHVVYLTHLSQVQ